MNMSVLGVAFDRNPLWSSLILLLLFQATVTSAFKLVDCKQQNAEKGATWCKEAFGNTYHDNKLKIITSPQKKGCCLTMSLRHCVEVAFTKAKCDPKEQKMALLIRDQIADAQRYVQKGLDAISSALCGEFRMEQCDEHFMRHYNQALLNITVLNGSGMLRASGFVTAAVGLLAPLYAARCF